jgi:hypothetical protein
MDSLQYGRLFDSAEFGRKMLGSPGRVVTWHELATAGLLMTFHADVTSA